MSQFGVATLIALVMSVPVGAGLLVPYLVRTYRRVGQVSPVHLLASVAALVEFIALWTFTLVPMPRLSEEWCRAHAVPPQVVPFHFVSELVNSPAGPVAVASQVVLNVVLFLPFGALGRYLLGWRWWAVGLLGLGTSLLIEFTQLTGNWGLSTCAYRVFDVDDLFANTTGALVGALVMAWILRRHEAAAANQDDHAVTPAPLSADDARPVTGAHRLLGMVLDVVLVTLGGMTVWILTALVLREIGWSALRVSEAHLLQTTLTTWLPAVVLLGALPIVLRGATPGQWVVRLRPCDTEGRPPTLGRMAVRFAVGLGGYELVSGVVGFLPDLWGVAPRLLLVLWALASVGFAFVGDHRGLSGRAAGLLVIDARQKALPRDRRWQGETGLGTMTAAVVFLVLLVNAVAVVVTALLSTGSGVIAIVVLGLLALAPLVVNTWLIANGITMVRREGRGIRTVLSLAAGVLGWAATVVLVAVVLWRPEWVILLVGPVVLVGYFGALFWAFLLYGLLYARRDPVEGMDAVVVLGSGIFGTRVPPLLASRIDRGMAVYRGEREAGRSPALLMSGGQGEGEDVSEASAMREFALDRGLAAGEVLVEDRSTTTSENLQFSAAVLAERGLETMVVVTNDFHAFRAAMLTRRLGLTAQVIGAPTARYFVPSAAIREFIGVIAGAKWVHLTMSLLIVAASVLLVAVTL